jgi:hypothetical protein
MEGNWTRNPGCGETQAFDSSTFRQVYMGDRTVTVAASKTAIAGSTPATHAKAV